MEYNEVTPIEAVTHFASHVFPTLFKGQRNPRNPEHKNAYDIIRDARNGKVSESRARALLEKFGGQDYRVTTAFEIKVTETNNT